MLGPWIERIKKAKSIQNHVQQFEEVKPLGRDESTDVIGENNG